MTDRWMEEACDVLKSAVDSLSVKDGSTISGLDKAASIIAAALSNTYESGRRGAGSYQDRVAEAHHALFHDDPTDIPERLARHVEETLETAQAFGMSADEVRQLVDYTFSRPVGEPAKEIGANLLTLASLCIVTGHDMMTCGEADLEKLKRPETITRIRAKRATRHGRGPLPGLDPAAIRSREDKA